MAVVIAYFLLCFLIGVWKFTSIKTLKDFSIHQSKVSTSVLVITLFATYVGAGATIGAINQIYSIGLLFAVSLLFKPLFWLVMTRIYADKIGKFRAHMTMGSIMGELYGDKAKWITNVGGIILAIGITAVQVAAIGHILSDFFSIPFHYGISIGATILILYTALGGIKAVAATDVFQFGIFFIIIPIAFSYFITDIGGIKPVLNTMPTDIFSKEL